MTRTLCTGVLATLWAGSYLFGQSLGNAGTIEGSVLDPSGAAIPSAAVTIRNGVTGYNQSATTGADGAFRLTNIPPNSYHLEVVVNGFTPYTEDVTVRKAIPVRVKAKTT